MIIKKDLALALDDIVLEALIQLRQPSGDDHGPAVFHETVGALAETNNLAGATHRVGELELEVLHVADDDLDVDEVLERGGTFVAAVDGDYRRYDALSFDAIETIAELVQEIDTCFLHETDVIGVMGDAHAVALVIFHFVLVNVHITVFFCLTSSDAVPDPEERLFPQNVQEI